MAGDRKEAFISISQHRSKSCQGAIIMVIIRMTPPMGPPRYYGVTGRVTSESTNFLFLAPITIKSFRLYTTELCGSVAVKDLCVHT